LLVTSQFPALVPGQQSDDVVLYTRACQRRGGEMAEIVDAQSIDACKLCHAPKSLPKIPCMRSFEIAFEPQVGFGRL